MKRILVAALTLVLALALNLSAAGNEYKAIAEQMPAPDGGVASIYKHVTYPKLAQDAGLEGTVYLLAYINEEGSVDKVDIVKGIGGGCDEAAAKAVRATKFTPASDKGVKVKAKLAIPVNFKLK